MNKYNKIMDKINVTPEMEQRILNNIHASTFESTAPKVYWLQKYRGTLSIAACLLIFIIGTFSIYNNFNINNPPEINYTAGPMQYSSKSELSSAVDFDIKEVTNVPFNVLDTQYMSYGNDLAEIIYTGNDHSLSFRMAKGTDDISGDYTVYENIQNASIGPTNVTLKGNNHLYNLALWQDETFTYALQLDYGISQTQLIQIIQFIQ